MIPFHSKRNKLPGTDYREAYKSAIDYFSQFKAKTKRQPYVRSAYFNKEKVFLNLFWQHLFQKPQVVRKSRLKLFAAAIDLIAHSRNRPTLKPNPNEPRETLYRFAGLTKKKKFSSSKSNNPQTAKSTLCQSSNHKKFLRMCSV